MHSQEVDVSGHADGQQHVRCLHWLIKKKKIRTFTKFSAQRVGDSVQIRARRITVATIFAQVDDVVAPTM